MKHLFLSIAVLCALSTFSQETIENDTKKIKSFSFAVGGFKPYSGGNGNANFYVSIDGTYMYNKNLFTASLNRGFDFDIVIKGTRYNLSFDALYGREVKLLPWLYLEAHIGIGLFRGSYYKSKNDTWEIVTNADNSKNHITPLSISFPAKFKILFYHTKTSSIGVNLNYNANNVSNYIAYNLIYQKNL